MGAKTSSLEAEYGTLNPSITMRVSLIAALDSKRVIGSEGKIPWRLPAYQRSGSSWPTAAAKTGVGR